MHRRDPGMLRVPDDRRDRANHEDPEQPIKPRTLKLLTQPRREGEYQQNTDDFECVGESAEKSQTNQQSG